MVAAIRTMLLGLVLFLGPRICGADEPQTFPDARASDPIKLGWMIGSPPPADKLIRFEDGSYRLFPQTRWSFSHWSEFRPVAMVSHGSSPISLLPRRERADLDGITFVPIGSNRSMTWAESLDVNYTDGIIVLHRGRIVFERYFGALNPERAHIAFSATKSFFGTIAATLIAEGKLDPSERVDHYIPELKESGFADATVAQVLDMTTALKYSENYDDPKSDIYNLRYASGALPTPAGYNGPRSQYEYLATIQKSGDHGAAFAYGSINSCVVGWLISRSAGKSPQEVLEQRIWTKLGTEGDAYLELDPTGSPYVAGGLNTSLRDMARFGEMIRRDGYFNGQRIVPVEVIADIRRGGSREAFAKAGYKTLPGWSYHNQWWVSHDDHGTLMARGIHGQAVYIDPKAEMVIARFASNPRAGNAANDATSLPAYRAMADRLMMVDR
jgi:CubicO group peptidase (beta-lactamase class C family)